MNIQYLRNKNSNLATFIKLKLKTVFYMYNFNKQATLFAFVQVKNV